MVPLSRLLRRAVASATPLTAEAYAAEERIAVERGVDCDVCGGARFVGGRITGRRGRMKLDGGMPPAFREILPCPACAAPEPSELVDRAQLPPAYRGLELDSFELRPGKAPARDAVVRWCQRVIADEPASLLLAGEYGRGKTHLAAVAVHILAQRGVASRFAFVADLLQEIRSSFGEEHAPDLLDRFARWPVLVLDDLARVQVTPWVEETVTTLVDRRQRSELPTLLTLDVDQRQIAEQFGGALASRLRMYEAVVVGGEDMRGVT